MAKPHLYVKATPAANIGRRGTPSHPTLMIYDGNSDDFVYKKEGVQKDNHIPFKFSISLLFVLIISQREMDHQILSLIQAARDTTFSRIF